MLLKLTRWQITIIRSTLAAIGMVCAKPILYALDARVWAIQVITPNMIAPEKKRSVVVLVFKLYGGKFFVYVIQLSLMFDFIFKIVI